MNVRNVVIFTKPKQADVARVAGELSEWFQRRKVAASIKPETASTADLAVVVGGDGTLLAALRGRTISHQAIGLKQGMAAYAVIKASDVMVAVD